jgi:TonB family protein
MIQVCGAVVVQQDVEQSLKQQYEGKILVLRHPLQDGSMEFDSDGKVLKGGSEGPWTLYGRIKIDELKLQADKLLLKGMRVGYKFDDKGKLAPFPTKKHVSVQISLTGTPQKMTDVDDVLTHIFAVTRKDIVGSAPDFWRQYLERNLPAPDGQAAAESDMHVAPPVIEAKTVEVTLGDAKAGEPKTGESKAEGLTLKKTTMIGPQAVYTPAPYPPKDGSGSGNFSPVILNIFVDETGGVGRIRIVRPLGEGYDEAAVSAVKKWRFKPAQRDGHPVGVEMNIECVFNVVR